MEIAVSGARIVRVFGGRESGPGPVLLKNATAGSYDERFWELTLREAAPAILAAHAPTAEELDASGKEMREIARMKPFF